MSILLYAAAQIIVLTTSRASAQYDAPNIRGAINSDLGGDRDGGAGGATAADITSILRDMHLADDDSGLGKLNRVFERGRQRIRENRRSRNRRRLLLGDEAVTPEVDRRGLSPGGGDTIELDSAPFRSSRRLCPDAKDYDDAIFFITPALSPYWFNLTDGVPLYVVAAEGEVQEFSTELDGNFTTTSAKLGQKLELKDIWFNLDDEKSDMYLWKKDDYEIYLEDASKDNPFEDYYMDVPKVKKNKKLIIQDKDQFRHQQVWSFHSGCKNCGHCDNTWRPAGVNFPSEKELCVTADITRDGNVKKSNAISLSECKNKGLKRMKQTWILCGQAVRCKEDGFDVEDVNPPAFEVRVEYKLDEETLDLGKVPQAIDDRVGDVSCSGIPSSKTIVVQSGNVDKMERFDVGLKKHCNNDGLSSSTEVDLRILNKKKGVPNYNNCVAVERGSENCNSEEDKNVDFNGNDASDKDFLVALSDYKVNSTGLEFNLDITHRGRYTVETVETKKLPNPWNTVEYGSCLVNEDVFPSFLSTPDLSIWYFKLEKETLRVDADNDFVYPNPSITVRSTCNERGDNNAATLFQLFEVTGSDSYNCIDSFQTDCLSLGSLNQQTTFENLDNKKKYSLVVTGSLENPDCEYTSPECSNAD